MKRSMLALIVVLTLASLSVGGSFAGFSDTETSEDNTVDMGSLDLKVARCVDSCEPDDLEFCDDEPWGTGLFPERNDGRVKIVPCFKAEEDGMFAKSYQCDLKLWNAGSADGWVFVYIKNVTADPETLLSETTVDIWYDQDDDGEIDDEETVAGTLEELACQPVPLEPIVWLLPAEEPRNLQIVIDPPEGSPGDILTFDIEFGLIGIFFIEGDELIMMNSGFCDTEVCLDNYLEVKEEEVPP